MTATDPVGRTVVLDADAWVHILAEHLEMAGHRSAIMATVALDAGEVSSRRPCASRSGFSMRE
jgi:hypothetical protein